ncbi:MAG: hypothetical protein JSU78_02340 [Deltaproteobacteria bacterium]|nr:MAG: hypothetical protein JSU78_02340 [Deltaproteobacteria bacterium]
MEGKIVVLLCGKGYYREARMSSQEKQGLRWPECHILYNKFNRLPGKFGWFLYKDESDLRSLELNLKPVNVLLTLILSFEEKYLKNIYLVIKR